MKLLTVITLICLCSCQSQKEKAEIDPRIPQTTYNEDSSNARIRRAKLANISTKCPVKIVSSSISDGEIHIKYRNEGKKTISAIRFQWITINSFGEVSITSNGQTDRELSIGQTSNGTWSSIQRNAKKISKLDVLEIAFTDGTKW